MVWTSLLWMSCFCQCTFDMNGNISPGTEVWDKREKWEDKSEEKETTAFRGRLLFLFVIAWQNDTIILLKLQAYEVLHNNIINALWSKATFSFISSPLSILWERQFEIKEKNEKRKVKRTKKETATFFRKLPFLFGPPGGIRTPGLQNRNLLRYPASLRAEIVIFICRNFSAKWLYHTFLKKSLLKSDFFKKNLSCSFLRPINLADCGFYGLYSAATVLY